MTSLAHMKADNVSVIRTCTSPCKYWITEDLDALIAELGPNFSLIDERPPCPVCDRLMHFMAAPGSGTPLRPMLRENRPDPRRPPEGWPEWPGKKLRNVASSYP